MDSNDYLFLSLMYAFKAGKVDNMESHWRASRFLKAKGPCFQELLMSALIFLVLHVRDICDTVDHSKPRSCLISRSIALYFANIGTHGTQLSKFVEYQGSSFRVNFVL